MNYHRILQRFYIKSRVSIFKHGKKYFNKKKEKKKLRSNHRGHLVSPQKSKMPIKYIFTLEQIQLKNFKKFWWVYNMKYPPPFPPI